MKSKLFLAVVFTLALIVLVMSGETGQTQGPVGSDALSTQAGSAETGREDSRALPGGSVRQAEDIAPDPAATYNAYVRVPAAALKPRQSDVEWDVSLSGGCNYASAGDQYTWWAAPLYLPDGSTIQYFRMYFNDTNATASCVAYLTVYDLYGDIVTEWGVNSSGYNGENYVTTPQISHTVDYSQYSYVINWQPNAIGSTMQVCGFRIYYQSMWGTTFLPNVMN